MSANSAARLMTTWPDAHDHAAQITDTDHNVGEVQSSRPSVPSAQMSITRSSQVPTGCCRFA